MNETTALPPNVVEINDAEFERRVEIDDSILKIRACMVKYRAEQAEKKARYAVEVQAMNALKAPFQKALKAAEAGIRDIKNKQEKKRQAGKFKQRGFARLLSMESRRKGAIKATMAHEALVAAGKNVARQMAGLGK